MNKEIEVAINEIKTYIETFKVFKYDYDDRFIKYLKIVLDYITSLEQANKNTYETSQDLLSEIQEKIDKAIEYCEKSNLTLKSHYFTDLLHILKEGVNDE